MNALIIEDDEFLAKCLKNSFERTTTINNTRILSSYTSYMEEAHTLWNYDIVLVDIMLWKNLDKTGIDIIKHIRSKNLKVPLIVLSWLSDISWLQKSFFAGANDFILKPFRIQELQIRVSRWYENYFCSFSTLPSPKIHYYDLIFDVRNNTFSYKWEELILTKTHKYILSILLAFPEKVVSEKYLKEKIWWDIFEVIERNVKIHMFRLKKQLNNYWIEDWIVNIRGEGHMLRKPKNS